MAESRVPVQPTGKGVPSSTSRPPSSLLKAFGWLAIFGIGAAIGAILGAADVSGWVIGVVVSGTTVVLGFFLRRALTV